VLKLQVDRACFHFFHGKDPKKQVHNPVEKWNKRKKKRNKEEKKE